MTTADKPKDTGSPTEPNLEEHALHISDMFGKIVRWYDPLNHILSGGLDRRWRNCLADAALPSDLFASSSQHTPCNRSGPPRILDLATGTLDVALALRRRYPDIQVLALDFCSPMLLHGRNKLREKDKAAIWPVIADARALPFPDASVDGVTMAFGIRNILPRSSAFTEMHRVLVPGGRACILEFGSGRKHIWLGVYNFYLTRILPLIGRLSGNAEAYRYLADTILDFPDADTLVEEIRQAGFGRIYHIPLCSGIVRLHVAEKPKHSS